MWLSGPVLSGRATVGSWRSLASSMRRAFGDTSGMQILLPDPHLPCPFPNSTAPYYPTSFLFLAHILQVRLQVSIMLWKPQRIRLLTGAVGPRVQVRGELTWVFVGFTLGFSWTSAGHSILEFLGEEVRICILRKVSQVIGMQLALGSLTVIYKSQTEKKAWKKKMGQCVFLKFSEHLLCANCSSLTVSLHRTEQSTRRGWPI